MRALVLSGGGAKGAYEAGVVVTLIDEFKENFDIICGTSIGAINASLVAQENTAELAQLWRGIGQAHAADAEPCRRPSDRRRRTGGERAPAAGDVRDRRPRARVARGRFARALGGQRGGARRAADRCLLEHAGQQQQHDDQRDDHAER